MTTDKLLASARHWDNLADAEERRARWEGRHGNVDAFHVRARTYRRAAESLRMQHDTGIGHCYCHLIPLTECANLKRSQR